KRIVLSRDDECGRQAAQLPGGCTQRGDVRIVPGLLVWGVQVPAVLHEGTRKETAGSELVIGTSVDACIRRRDEEDLNPDLRTLSVLRHQGQCRRHVSTH